MTLPPLPEPDAEMPIKWPDGKRTREPLWMRDRMDSYARAAVEAEREAILFECVPGGSICDPQQIADAIRARGGEERGNG